MHKIFHFCCLTSHALYYQGKLIISFTNERCPCLRRTPSVLNCNYRLLLLLLSGLEGIVQARDTCN